MMPDRDEPEVLSYGGKPSPTGPPPRAETLLLMVAVIALCLPPVSMGLSVLSILRGLQLSRTSTHANISAGRILTFGGMIVLLLSTSLTVWMILKMR